MLESKYYQPIEWRESENLPFFDLLGIECMVIMFLQTSVKGIIRLERLDNHLTLRSCSSSTPGYLLKHLKGTLITTKIRRLHQTVSIQYGYKRYVVEMQTFGHHLCPDKDINFVFCKSIDDTLMAVLVTCRIQIHTCHTGVWEKSDYFVFNSLGTNAIIAPFAIT